MESLFADLRAKNGKMPDFFPSVSNDVLTVQSVARRKRPPLGATLMYGWKGKLAYSLESMDALYS